MESWVRYRRQRAVAPRGIDPASAAVTGGNGGSEIVRVLDAVAGGFRGRAVPDMKCQSLPVLFKPSRYWLLCLCGTCGPPMSSYFLYPTSDLVASRFFIPPHRA
jgi:uncharacterized membrane protein YeiH